MKINVNQIPPEGLTFEETISPGEFDLDTDIVKILEPIKLKAEVSKITNTVSVSVAIDTAMHLVCARCLTDFETSLKKDLKLNYDVDKSVNVIELGEDIREDIILDYPIKPLCRSDCKGLCPKCGKNLNEGGCSCGST